MKLEATNLSNYKLVIGDDDTPIGVQINGVVAFRLNDIVEVTADCRGYIAPGITSPGVGKIVEIRRHDTDHFFVVQMDNGESGFVKDCRMKRCC